MKEFNKLSTGLFVLLVAFSAFCLYDNAKSNRGLEIYDTKKLTTKEKEVFKDAIKTADAYVYYGDHQKAVEELKKAEKLNPADIQTLYHLASSQHNAKQYEDAEKTLAKLENAEINIADYWSFRARNLSNVPTSLNNMKRAAEYFEKSMELATFKDSYMTYELKATIYFNLYKYYRGQRTSAQEASQDELSASKKFFEALAEIKRIADERKICRDESENFKGYHCERYYDDIKSIHDKFYSKYKAFPNVINEESAPPFPKLQTLEYTQADIEYNKKHRPQYNLPRKK